MYLYQLIENNRRALVETPVAIVSETPLVNRGTSPRKQWKKREKTIPLDLERDVYVSDEDYIFHFHFTFSLRNEENDILNKFEQFQIDFWHKQHHWYTEYSAVIYIIPYLLDTYTLKPHTKRL